MSIMAESGIDITMKSSAPSILTEEMIDAAMSQRLNMLEDLVSSHKKSQGDHSHSADSDYSDDDDSSDNDFHAVSVIDSDDIQDITTSYSKREEKDAAIMLLEHSDKIKDDAILMTTANEKHQEKQTDVVVMEPIINNNNNNNCKPDNPVLTVTSNEDQQEKDDTNLSILEQNHVKPADTVLVAASNGKPERKESDSAIQEPVNNTQNNAIRQGIDNIQDNLISVTISNEDQQEKDIDLKVRQLNCKIQGDAALVKTPDEINQEKNTVKLQNENTLASGIYMKKCDEKTLGNKLQVIDHEKCNNKACEDSVDVDDPNKLGTHNTKDSNVILITPSGKTIMNADKPNVAHETVESKNKIKQSLTVKPMSNLLKFDFVKKDKNVKIFKCVQGKIEMSPGVVNKSTENCFPIQTTGINPDSHSNLQSEYKIYTSKNNSVKNKGIGKLQKSRTNSNKSGKSCGKDKVPVILNDVVLEPQNYNGKRICDVIGNSLSSTIEKSTAIRSENSENMGNSSSLGNESGKECISLNSELPVISTNCSVQTDAIVSKESSNCDSAVPITTAGGITEKKPETSPIFPVSNQQTDVRVCCKTINVSNMNLNNKTTINSNSIPFIQRRQILPKINYRYHTKDKLIVSDTLPKNKLLTVGTKKGNEFCILPDGTNAHPLLIMSPDMVKANVNNSAVTGLNPPHNNPVPMKFIVNKLNSSTGEIDSITKTVSTSSQSVNDQLSSSSTTAKLWEKVDRFTLSNETSQQKLEEFSISSLKSQLLEREVPPYVPIDCNKYYSCLDCNDRFVLESSLRNHRFRKSVLIKYWCRTCSCLLNMYNRCMFLAHIRSHNQLVKHLDMSSLSIEPLPKSLIKLGTNEEVNNDSPQTPTSFANPSITNSSPILISLNSPIEITKQSIPASVIQKPVSSSVAKSNVMNGIICNKTPSSYPQRVVKTVPKLVPSGCTKDDQEKESVNNNNEDGDDDDSNSGNVGDNNGNVHHDEENSHTPINIEPDIEIVDVTPSKSISVAPLKENGPTLDSSSNQNISESNDTPVCNAGLDLTEDHSRSDKQFESQTKSKSVKGKRKCPECDVLITAKCSLRKHLQNANRPGDESLKCNVCRLILPTKCSLKMHLRIHMKLKPFRCPECAIEFHIFDRFLMHLKYTCCHLSKCIRYVCTLCGNMQLSLVALEQHLTMRHVRPIFKCGNCPLAFVTLKSVEKHKEKAHPGVTVETSCYHQCRLCPEKLIPKKKFLAHLKGHISDDRLCIYAYQCPTCKNTFFQRTELIYHRMQCDTRDGIIRSVLSSPPVSPVSDDVTQPHIPDDPIDNYEEEKEIILPAKKRKLENDDEVEIVDDEQDPLSLEGFQSKEEPLREPLIELCVVCKKEKVVILPGKNKSSQSLCCKKCVRPCGRPIPENSNVQKSVSENRSKLQAARLKFYKCKICKSPNSMDLKLIYEHFKTYHKELEGQSINEWLVIENKSPQIKRSNTITTAETIKEKYNKKKKLSLLNIQPSPVKKEPDDDFVHEPTTSVTEKKKSKRLVKPKPKSVERKCFESGQIITLSEDTKTDLNCSKCDFVASSRENFRDHVVCHRTDPNALQCLECGECFVVLPSLEKHLIINHRILDVNCYIDSNKQYIDGSANKSETQEDGNDEVDEETNFICKVCHERYESKTALDKHFRSHGMAFLFKNLLQ